MKENLEVQKISAFLRYKSMKKGRFNFGNVFDKFPELKGISEEKLTYLTRRATIIRIRDLIELEKNPPEK